MAKVKIKGNIIRVTLSGADRVGLIIKKRLFGGSWKKYIAGERARAKMNPKKFRTELKNVLKLHAIEKKYHIRLKGD